MKIFRLVALILNFTFLTSCNSVAQDGVPSEVKATFKKMYPNENDPDWRVDKNGYYESHFKKKGIHYRADFDKSGKWIETENNIKKDELPKAVKKVLKEKYDDVKIYEIEEVSHHSKGKFYDVELKINGKKKDVEFNSSGKIIN